MSEMKLNSNQQKAVEHTGSPLLIVAGAGTGKTTVITERVIHLIEKKNVLAESILALTFTEKASNEMLERVDIRLPLGHSEVTIKTFHAFCDQVLRQYGLEIGLNIGYKMLTEIDSWMFFKDHLFDFNFNYYRPIGNPTKFIAALVSYFGKLQDENVIPEEYLDFVEKMPLETEEDVIEKSRHDELSKAYQKYLEIKLKEDVLEFSDMHYYVLKLFRERPNVLRRVREQYDHILVDEFQDTNLIQFELLKMLAEDGKNLTVVADDDQSIYAFRGSNIANILNFSKVYPNVEKITLIDNYRSKQDILDKSYELIQNNNPERLEVREGLEKKLISRSGGNGESGGNVIFQQFSKEVDEVSFVVDEIEEEIKKGRDLSEMAILVRANSHVTPFTDELTFRGIPYQFMGLRGLYEREEVKDLLSFLRFLRNQRDDASLYRILKLKVFGFEMDEILLLLNEARRKKSSLWGVLKRLDKEKAKKMVEILSGLLEKSREYRGGAVLYEFVKEYYYPPLLENESIENQRKILNISQFFEKIKQFESRSDKQDIVYLIDFLDLVIEAGENPATAESELDAEAIQIMTVHGSKGLEFPLVFLPSLVSQRFPSMNRSETIPFPDGLKKDLGGATKTNISEERRLFYVACTRAKDKLYLSASRYYGEAKRPKKTSQFVSELGIVLKDATGGDENDKSQALNLKQILNINDQDSKRETKNWEMPKRLSYSQISSFKDCPRKYEYSYIYKIPGEGSPALSFGISMHNTLKRFYDYLEISEIPSLFEEKRDDLEMLFSIYDNSFIYSDYLSRKHQQQAYEGGKETLKKYYEENGPQFKLPYLSEKSFVIPMGDYVFSGRFDRVDKLDDGSVEVIDYKTGKVKKQKEVDKDLQLSLYALACRDALNLKPSKLTLYFLSQNEKVESLRSDEQMDKAKSEFIGIADQMKESDFAPTPGMFVCQYCPYRNICNASGKRQAGKLIGF